MHRFSGYRGSRAGKFFNFTAINRLIQDTYDLSDGKCTSQTFGGL